MTTIPINFIPAVATQVPIATFRLPVSSKLPPIEFSQQPEFPDWLRTPDAWFTPTGLATGGPAIGTPRAAHRMATGSTPNSTPGEVNGFEPLSDWHNPIASIH